MVKYYMKVYRISKDTHYWDFASEKAEDELSSACWEKTMKGQPLSDDWPTVQVYLRTPDMPPSDFFGAPILGRFAISEKVYSDNLMRSFLESAGELLPMKIRENGSSIYVFSLLPKSICQSAVDLSRCDPSQWDCNYAFDTARLPAGKLFSIPGSIHAYVAYDDKLSPNLDFIQWYRRQGYTGLEFEEQTGTLPPPSVNPYKKAK